MNFSNINEYPIGKIRISLGEMSFGKETQSTYLGSCISLILHSPSKRIGGISHIVGSTDKEYPFNTAEDVINQYYLIIKEHQILDPTFYLIGGTEKAFYTAKNSLEIINKHNIFISKFDILGDYYRNICYDPVNEIIEIEKYLPSDILN